MTWSGCPQNLFTGLHIPAEDMPTRCARCGARRDAGDVEVEAVAGLHVIARGGWAEYSGLAKLAPFAPYVRLVPRDKKRTDLEFRAHPEVTRAALAATIICPKCGRVHHPFRERNGEGGRQWDKGIFFGVACPQEGKKKGCGRSPAAHRAARIAQEFFAGGA